MKKFSLIVFVLLFYSAQSFSQLYAGIKGGVIFSSMTGGFLGIAYDDLGEIGGTTGLMAEYVVNDFFSFSPEITFARKGTEFYKKESVNTIDTRSDVYHFGYIEIPLLAKFSYTMDFMEVYGKTGPYLGFIAGGMASEQGTAIIGKREMSLDDFFAEREQDFSKFDMGWYLGFGSSIFVGPGKLFLGLHYDIGFIEVAKNQAIPPYEYKSMGNNRAIVIEGGYLFEF